MAGIGPGFPRWVSPPADKVPEGWEPYTEHDQIVEWRQSQLQRSGMEENAALVLARGDGDLHKMMRAAESGLEDQAMLRLFG